MARRTADKFLSLLLASAGAAVVTALSTALLGPCAYAEMTGECDADLEWRASPRDVFMGGELRPQIGTWSAEHRLALWVPDALDALVIETVDDRLRVLSMPKAAWRFEDPQTASSKLPQKEIEGRVHRVADGLWLEAGGESYLILPHQGAAGEIERDELWRQAPLWRELHGAYEPEAAAVEALESEQRELELTVAFGTWCGDSRRSVPRLLKALDAAANTRLSVRLVSIDRGFGESLDFARRERITNVPTVILRQGGREIGRFVERPRSEVVEKDVAAILAGRPLPPDVFFDDSDRLLASAVLGLFDAGKRVGEERWRLFATDDGGRRLFVERHDAAGATETWLRLDADHRPAFAEVTRRSGAELSRTRLFHQGGHVDTLTRGDATGIVRQSVDWPEETLLLAPGLSGVGLVWSQAGRPTDRRSISAYALAPVDAGAPGRIEAAALDWLEAAPLDTAAGRVDTVALRLESGGRAGRYWLHRLFDMPVAARLDDGRRLVLESLRVEPAASEALEGDAKL